MIENKSKNKSEILKTKKHTPATIQKGKRQQLHFLTQAMMIVLFIIFVLVIIYTAEILLLTFAGILLAIFLRSISDLLAKYIHVSEGFSLFLTLILFLAALCALPFLLFTPVLSEQINELATEIPKSWKQLEEQINQLFHFKLIDINQLKDSFSLNKHFLFQAMNFFSNSFGIIGSFFIFLAMGIFFAYNPQPYIQGIILLTPNSLHSKIKLALKRASHFLLWWIWGRLFSMFIVGIFTSLGLWLLHVPLALILGLIAMLLNFIPNIGPIIAAIPAALLAWIQSPIMAAYVILLYISIQIIESYILTPMIQQKTLSLPPALIIFVQLIMAVLAGILGLALATPLLAVFLAFFEVFYIENRNHCYSHK
jgi:predicted PurR-regulated permease PerM